MPLAFVAIALASQLLVATPPAVPSVDIHKTCEAGAGTVADLMSGGTIQHDLEVCLKSEQDAHDQIVNDWQSYSAAEKTQCIQPSVYLPSYIEWLTCLEMESSVRKWHSTPPHGERDSVGDQTTRDLRTSSAASLATGPLYRR